MCVCVTDLAPTTPFLTVVVHACPGPCVIDILPVAFPPSLFLFSYLVLIFYPTLWFNPKREERKRGILTTMPGTVDDVCVSPTPTVLSSCSTSGGGGGRGREVGHVHLSPATAAAAAAAAPCSSSLSCSPNDQPESQPCREFKDFNGIRTWGSRNNNSRSSSALDRHSESSESLDNHSSCSANGGRQVFLFHN